MRVFKHISIYTYIFTYKIYPYVIIWIYIMLQVYDMSDVNPYCYQIIKNALDHKGGNEFSVVLFF